MCTKTRAEVGIYKDGRTSCLLGTDLWRSFTLYYKPCRMEGMVKEPQVDRQDNTKGLLRRSSLRQQKKATGRLPDAYVDCTCCAGLNVQCLTIHQHVKSTYVSI